MAGGVWAWLSQEFIWTAGASSGPPPCRRRDFPDFIERYEHAQSMPWLADVARIERAWLDAYHAADTEALSAEAPGRSL